MVFSDVYGSVPWRFNISGQSLFPGGECLARVEEQLARHQGLASPAPTQAPGDKGDPPCFGHLVTLTCCWTWSPAPCGNCTFLPLICKGMGFCFPLQRDLWRTGLPGLSLKHPLFKRHCHIYCTSHHNNSSILCSCRENSGEQVPLKWQCATKVGRCHFLQDPSSWIRVCLGRSAESERCHCLCSWVIGPVWQQGWDLLCQGFFFCLFNRCLWASNNQTQNEMHEKVRLQAGDVWALSRVCEDSRPWGCVFVNAGFADGITET